MLRILVQLALVLAILQQSVSAKCRTEDVETPRGILSHSVCRDDQKRYLHEIKLVDHVLLKGDFFAEEANSNSRLLWIFSSKPSAEIGCSDRVYLLDLTYEPPKAFQFGVKKACNEFYRAVWGGQRSVITIKKNVSFFYENGRVVPPVVGKKLWDSIEPPHAGPGLKMEDAVPFAEEIALP